MYCQRRKQMWVLLHVVNKVLASTLSCCIVLFFTSSCAAESPFAEVRPSGDRHPSHFRPLYFREFFIDWHYGFQEGLGEVEVNGKWGFINSAGEIVIKPKFDEVFRFREGIGMVRSGAIIKRRKAAFVGLAGRLKYIDKKGQVIIDNPVGTHFSEGLAAVCIQGKLTVSLLEGAFSREVAKFGFIDTKGEMVIPAKYDFVDSFSEGLAAFEDPNGKYGYINVMGEIVIEPRYDAASAFSEGLAVVRIGSKRGFINKRGDFTPLQYQSVSGYSEGLAAVEKDNKWGYIDRSGRLVIPLKFDRVELFSEGYAAVIVEGKIGYIDTNGKYAIEPRFEHFPYWESPGISRVAPFLSSFSEGLAAVMVEGKWGYIDKRGDFVIEPKFDIAGRFTEGFAKVAVGDKLGYIDKQGKYIWEPRR